MSSNPYRSVVRGSEPTNEIPRPVVPIVVGRNDQTLSCTWQGKVYTFMFAMGGLAMIILTCIYFPLHTTHLYGDCPDNCYEAACTEKGITYVCACDREMGPPTCEIKPILSSDGDQKRIGIGLIILGSFLFGTCILPVICSRTQEQRRDTHMPMQRQTAAAVTTHPTCQV